MNLFSTNIAYASVESFIARVDAQIINPLIVFLFALAVVYFLYGLVEFLGNAENDEKRSIGKSHMIWGVVGLTIMMGVWAILWVILNTLGITGINPPTGEVTLPPYTPPTYPPNN